MQESLKDLGEALVRAAPQGYLRVFLDEGDALRNLLVEMVKSGVVKELGIDAGYLNKLLEEFGIAIDRGYTGASAHSSGEVSDANLLRDKLTEKEIVILRLLNEGKRNKDIAEILFVTEGTVKWHLHNIYTKLDVRGRAEAVSLARKLTVVY